MVWSATYDSFGNCQVDTEVITNNLRFAGQYYDGETGLHYNWHRYYDPQTGRYLQTDPFGDGLNLYAYCFNNPNSLIDPLGLCAIKSIIGENLVKFFKGAGEALFTSVYELLATVYDIEQLLIYNFTGSFEATSGLFKALNSGVSVGELLLGMAEGIVDVPIEYFRAIASGDPERIGAATFNFAALIYAVGKTGKGIKGKFGKGAAGDIAKISKSGGVRPVNVGNAGEAAAGITGPKTRIPSLTNTARYRVPDELTSVSLREVKNALKLSNTAQLQDFLKYSQETNRTFILEVRKGTKLSKPLQKLVDEGLIDLRRTIP